ncbi:MAG: recombinase family protein [Oscillospiraceae bacterium]|nr:recombinase family protein [Oscillospiraceae bacterium]
MAKTVEQRRLQKPVLPRRKRVAAYARVSSAKDAMHHSLSAQVSYYSDLIQRRPDWEYAGVYADEAKTGTRDTRENFQRLLEDCRAGRVEMVITKSISRFARNTVTLLSTVRELKGLGVDVFFEEQNIHTLSAEGELMLTILASYAQEESRSVSENMHWRVKKNFEEGLPWGGSRLGYRFQNGRLVVHPDEAETVRRIYREFLSGKGVDAIANGLNADGIPTIWGYEWRNNGVLSILRNYYYTGNMILQQYYCDDFISKKCLPNIGQMPKYHVTGSHEAIISMETYEEVQKELERRSAQHAPKGKDYNAKYPYSGLIVCANCGKKYRRKVTHAGPVWICSTYNTKGKAACASKAIPEAVLNQLTSDVSLKDLAVIRAEEENRLVFLFKDGSTRDAYWQDRSRAKSWTPEMKAAARARELERRACNG